MAPRSRVFKALGLITCFILGRPGFQRFNKFLLMTLLKTVGYGNYSGDFKKSGEEKLIRVAREIGLDLIIDVGANKGHYASLCLELTDALVLSFEPMPGSFEMLKKLEAANPRLRVFNFALGDSDQTEQIYYGNEVDELATLTLAHQKIPYLLDNNVSQKRVNVRTLDGFIGDFMLNSLVKSVDLIKIDVEGYEGKVLKGASRVLAQYRPKIVILENNWHHLFTSDSIWSNSQFFQDYVAYRILPHGDRFTRIDPKSPIENIYLYSMYFFVRRDIEPIFLSYI